MANQYGLPFRLGTTSYIWPDDILPNVKQLAPLVDDVELVLFESDEYGSNLPSRQVVNELDRLAQANALTYTVHLPLDLRLADDESRRHPSLEKAQRVIERMQELDPYAYVVHLDGRNIGNRLDGDAVARWQSQAVRSLEQVVGWVKDSCRLCVENLENYDPDIFSEVIQATGVSRCADVGHLLLQNAEVVARLQEWQNSIRVMHIHGIGTRDHQSLALIDEGLLDKIAHYLMKSMHGVVTMEIFCVEDFKSSLSALESALMRCGYELARKEN